MTAPLVRTQSDDLADMFLGFLAGMLRAGL